MAADAAGTIAEATVTTVRSGAASGWPATWMRSGVEPPDPAVPNGSTPATPMPS